MPLLIKRAIFSMYWSFKTVTYHISTFVYFSICTKFSTILISKAEEFQYEYCFLSFIHYEFKMETLCTIAVIIFCIYFFHRFTKPILALLMLFEIWGKMVNFNGYHILPQVSSNQHCDFKLSLFKVNSSCGKIGFDLLSEYFVFIKIVSILD
jgi:hypothetical protein